MAVALVALFLALGGVAYGVDGRARSGRVRSRTAARSGRDIKDGAVQGRDVKDGTLLGSDLKDGGVRGNDVHDGSLGGIDVADGTLRGGDLAKSAIGDREDPRDPTRHPAAGRLRRQALHPQGCSEGGGVETANDATTPKVAAPAKCPKKTRLLGGGAHVVAARPVPVAIGDNGPSGEAWTASAYATTPTGAWQLVVVAICG